MKVCHVDFQGYEGKEQPRKPRHYSAIARLIAAALLPLLIAVAGLVTLAFSLLVVAVVIAADLVIVLRGRL